MNTHVKFFWGIILIVILFVVYNTLFTVSEGQEAIVQRLGNLQKDTNGQVDVFTPGLHVKVPFITNALLFDTRIQTSAIQSSRIVTAEKKDVIVDFYVKWRITNLANFYTSTGGDVSRAELLLEQQVNNGLRAQFGQRTIPEVVSDDRSAIMDNLRKQTDQSAKPLGIDVIDVRIKAIDLPAEVSSAVFARMRAERQRVAAEHRANGQSLAEAIRAKSDADVTVIVAKATEKAAQLRATGDKESAAIWAKSYNQNPGFYAFYRSLLAYKNTFNSKQDVLLLGPDNVFFKYLHSDTLDKK
jgi:membrane protease subunit HflC